ncbi:MULTISPECIES: hypothetical protein [unclassified Alteromonas]|uniref:hypothetical protein n=1 Tax=unclassified Alteromonas TaxID=2614992 RepID=UPI0005093BE9|nr:MULTISPECIES: hypothetical protein [unclassified Alteromonas]
MNEESLWQAFLDEHLASFLNSLSDKDTQSPLNIEVKRLEWGGLGKTRCLIAMRKHIKHAKLTDFEKSFDEFKAQSRANLWTSYLHRHLIKFLKSVPESEYLQDKKALLESENTLQGTWLSLEPRPLYKAMRPWLSQSAIKQFQNRYRAFKHRGLKQTATIELSPRTKQLVDKVKGETYSENYDEVFEMLFSKDYAITRDEEVKAAKQSLADELPPSKNLFLEQFLLRLNPNDRNRVKMLIELSYSTGWDDAKKNRKRKGDPKMEALVDFKLFNTATRFTNTYKFDDESDV